MTIFHIQYRLKDYKISDAFRPDPKYGYRNFTVDGDKIGSNDIIEIRQAARLDAPDTRYELYSVKALTKDKP